MLGLAQLYFPMYEEKLAKYNMPQELKYLSIIESALNPTAKSKRRVLRVRLAVYVPHGGLCTT